MQFSFRLVCVSDLARSFPLAHVPICQIENAVAHDTYNRSTTSRHLLFGHQRVRHVRGGGTRAAFGYRPRKNPLSYNLQNDAIARKAVIRTHLTAGTQDLRVAFISIRIRHDDPIVGFLRRVDFGSSSSSSSRGGGRHWNLFVGQFRPGKFCRW